MSTRPTLIAADRVWNGLDAHPMSHWGVVVFRDRIVDVGPRHRLHRDHASADRIDLHGCTLLPGFVDMHVHLSDDNWMPQRLLMHGITTVRDTGNNHHALIKLRERQRLGQWVGPRIVSFGPLIDAAPAHWAHVSRGVADDENVEQIVDELIDAGVDGLKTYVKASPRLVERVVHRAKMRGMPVTCHCGACRASQALEMGMGCIEHVGCLDVLPEKTWWDRLDPDHALVKDMIRSFLDAGATFVPTLAVMTAVEHFWGRRFNEFPGYDQYPPYLRNWIKGFLMPMKNSDGWDDARIARADAGFKAMQHVTQAFYHARVPMLAGSDSPLVPPGIGFHEELRLLNYAGIPAHHVLTMATRAGAAYLKRENEFGTMRIGSAADLVAVRGNPFDDITHTRHIHAVWQRGRELDLNALRDQADHTRRNAAETYDVARPPFGIAYDAV